MQYCCCKGSMAVKIDLPRNPYGNRLHVVYAHEGDRKPLCTIKACLKCSTAATNHERTNLVAPDRKWVLVYANELYERNQVQAYIWKNKAWKQQQTKHLNYQLLRTIHSYGWCGRGNKRFWDVSVQYWSKTFLYHLASTSNFESAPKPFVGIAQYRSDDFWSVVLVARQPVVIFDSF